MSLSKRLFEEEREKLTQEQFNNYWKKLNQIYETPEEILDYNEVADIMNFEFDLNLSDVDIKKFRENSQLIEEEDNKLIYKNAGL